MYNQITRSISEKFNASFSSIDTFINIEFNQIKYNLTITHVNNNVTALTIKSQNTTNIMHIKKVCDDGAFGIMSMIDENIKQNDIMLIKEIAHIFDLEYIINENRKDMMPLYGEDLPHIMSSRIWINIKNAKNILLNNILNQKSYDLTEGISKELIKQSYDYSINLMWIWDKNKYDNMCTIFPLDTEWYVHNKSIVLNQNEINDNIKKGNKIFIINDLQFNIDEMKLYRMYEGKYVLIGTLYKTNFYDNIIGWSKNHPNGKIIVWYDSKYININILIKARTLFYEFNKQNPQYGRIYVKNIRSVQSFKDIDTTYPYLFSEYEFEGKNDFLYPIYLRVDLARHIIAYHCIKYELNYFIHADLDMTPQNYDFVFKNKKQLDIYGMIKAIHNRNVENSFFVLGSSIKIIRNQIAKIIYDFGIIAVIQYIEDQRSKKDNCAGGWSYMSNGRVEHIPNKYHPDEHINNCMYRLQEVAYSNFKNMVRAIKDNFYTNYQSWQIKEINDTSNDIITAVDNDEYISINLTDDILRPSRFA